MLTQMDETNEFWRTVNADRRQRSQVRAAHDIEKIADLGRAKKITFKIMNKANGHVRLFGGDLEVDYWLTRGTFAIPGREKSDKRGLANALKLIGVHI